MFSTHPQPRLTDPDAWRGSEGLVSQCTVQMQRQQEHPRSSSDLAAAINRLPIETYLDRDQLAALSARELKVRLERRDLCRITYWS